jgi:hypothetical protein
MQVVRRILRLLLHNLGSTQIIHANVNSSAHSSSFIAQFGFKIYTKMLRPNITKTTEIYTHVSSKQLQKIISPFDTL